MRENKPKKTRQQYRLDPVLVADMRKHARATRLTLTAIVEIAVAKYLQDRAA
jgi:hypothetical protein